MNRDVLTFRSGSWWKPQWDLFQGAAKIGELNITRQFTYAEAVATAHGKKWVLSHSPWSITTSSITVKDAAGKEIGKTKHVGAMFGTTVEIDFNGKAFSAGWRSWMSSEYFVNDENGKQVLKLTLGWWKNAAEVTVLDSTLDQETVDVLVFLSFYRASIMQMESSGAATGAGAVVVTGS